MQWTDEDGTACGEGPYGGTGYAQARGRQDSGRSFAAAHGDVLTVPSPETDTGKGTQPLPVVAAPEPEPDSGTEPAAPAGEPVRPVFVDSSGQRQRHVLRAARLLVVPAVAYVALLVSTMLGGPTVSAPFVPRPDPAHPATHRVSSPGSRSGTGHSAGSRGSHAGQAPSGPVGREAPSGPAGRPTAPSASPAATASTAPTAAAPGPTAAPTTTASASSAATPARSPKGRALGASHRPVK
ncbi:hypothetical protein AB0L59_13860 [Streptomyces sp. NPDC052109]|uniref:hypothetical protein n=1 Tax=Streptomyces sp. NPDC052109 TaxID=3155527 RepID=UPI0034198D6D